MPRSKSLLLGVGIGLVLLGAPALAAPEASKDALRQKAKLLFSDGQRALAAGDAAAAQKDFQEAYQTLPNAAVLLKIAECRTRLSDDHGAVDALERYLAERPNAPDRGDVESRIAAIKRKPGVVSVTTAPNGAAISVDGLDTGQTAPADVTLAPGEHTVYAHLQNYEGAQQTITVEFASRKAVDLTLAARRVASTGSAGKVAVATNEPESSPQQGRSLSPAFWVAVGGTVVGASVMTAFGILALDKHSQYEKAPTRALYDDGRRDALISDIALGVTAASAVTATVLFFTSKSGDDRRDHAFIVTPAFDRGGGGVLGRARF